MGNFNRGQGGDRGGKGGFVKRSFGGGGFGGRDSRGPSVMHDATCSKCGQACQVPFQPTGDRPVFCSNCFKTQDNGGDRRSGGKSFGGGFDRRSDKPMFEAVCAKCGNGCQVPFKPVHGKSVYCKGCFDKGGNPSPRSSDQFGAQFEVLNAKLDRILKTLNPAASVEMPKEKTLIKEIKKDKADPVKKVAVKKAAKKSQR